jgi:cobyrinic acid a,c-diamide synthase
MNTHADENNGDQSYAEEINPFESECSGLIYFSGSLQSQKGINVSFADLILSKKGDIDKG